MAAPAHHSLPGPDDITRRQLENGIVVLSRENFNSPSVVVSGYLQAGGLLDLDEKLGLANFTAAALMRGTDNRDFERIFDDLESAGASLGFSAGTHTVGFSGRALREDLGLLLELLSECLRQPVFPPEQISRLKAQLLTGLALRAQDTAEMASMTFDEIVYAGHPYRRPEDGFSETVAALTREDLAAFHRDHYGPRGMVLSVVGAVEPERAVELVRARLGAWENSGQVLPEALPPVTPLQAMVTRKVKIPGKSQADLVLGVAGPPRTSDDYLPASLGNSVLGQFGMFGRIGQAVRERAGLAYYAFSSLGGGMGPGPWYVNAGVAPGDVERAVSLVREEIARYVREPVDAEELADSQANFTGRLPLALESNGGVAGALLNLERYELDLDYYVSYAGRVAAVTAEEILDVSRRYLSPDRLGIAVAGP